MSERPSAENDARLRDLSERIDKALLSLTEIRQRHEYGSDGYKRITAKIEGVALVGSYVDEYLRVTPPGQTEATS